MQRLFFGFELQEDLIALLVIVTLLDECFHLGVKFSDAQLDALDGGGFVLAGLTA